MRAVPSGNRIFLLLVDDCGLFGWSEATMYSGLNLYFWQCEW